ncbi:uncharacterized protein LOC117732425 [Cyclopterus lumpus]|uniref:uncharacterized protein LOC117732425 n=1 Tax=Cyclopterus lumpus TaxID=8103 RepID=UPI001485C5AD|nr:uncharacterized protein LOC117732425 [Cyclopterus lumpus]
MDRGFLQNTRMTLIYSVILCLFVEAWSIRLCIKELTKRPIVWTSTMAEGQAGTLTCTTEALCSGSPQVHWEWTKADGQSISLHGDSLLCLIVDFCYKAINTLKLTPIAEDHNTDITCVAVYDHAVVKTTVPLTLRFPPKIQNGSQCMVEGKLVVCVCISRGNPLPLIAWPCDSLTNFSVTSWSHIQTVHSTITMLAADHNAIKCISSNELGRIEYEPALLNYANNNWSDGMNPKPHAALPWIIAGVSLSVNLVLLTTLITCTWGKSQQREPCDETTYATLNQVDDGQEYSVITRRARACATQEI